MTVMPNPFVDEDHRFVLDEAKFMFDIGYVPPAARPENFAKYLAVLDNEIAKVNGGDDLPSFIASPTPEFRAAEIEPLLKTLFRGL